MGSWTLRNWTIECFLLFIWYIPGACHMPLMHRGCAQWNNLFINKIPLVYFFLLNRLIFCFILKQFRNQSLQPCWGPPREGPFQRPQIQSRSHMWTVCKPLYGKKFLETLSTLWIYDGLFSHGAWNDVVIHVHYLKEGINTCADPSLLAFICPPVT